MWFIAETIPFLSSLVTGTQRSYVYAGVCVCMLREMVLHIHFVNLGGLEQITVGVARPQIGPKVWSMHMYPVT